MSYVFTIVSADVHSLDTRALEDLNLISLKISLALLSALLSLGLTLCLTDSLLFEFCPNVTSRLLCKPCIQFHELTAHHTVTQLWIKKKWVVYG